MHRLAELSAERRNRLGWLLLLTGAVVLVVAVWWIHYSSFARTTVIDGETVPLVVNYFNWVPRGWYWKALGFLAVFGASQMMLLGGARSPWSSVDKMTWALAAFTAFLTWIELVIIFGIVPSEWLSLSQTDLDWSPQKIFLTIPSWVMLGNEVCDQLCRPQGHGFGRLSRGDAGGAIVFAYKIQRPRQTPQARRETQTTVRHMAAPSSGAASDAQGCSRRNPSNS